MVEGKVAESFGPRLGNWLEDASTGKRTRLNSLLRTLADAHAPTHPVDWARTCGEAALDCGSLLPLSGLRADSRLDSASHGRPVPRNGHHGAFASVQAIDHT